MEAIKDWEYWRDMCVATEAERDQINAENQRMTAENKRTKELLREAIGGAMFASCKYDETDGVDPTWHCCTWNGWVERVAKEIGMELPVEVEPVGAKGEG
jgi:phage/plasmid-associated DNA primase